MLEKYGRPWRTILELFYSTPMLDGSCSRGNAAPRHTTQSVPSRRSAASSQTDAPRCRRRTPPPPSRLPCAPADPPHRKNNSPSRPGTTMRSRSGPHRRTRNCVCRSSKRSRLYRPAAVGPQTISSTQFDPNVCIPTPRIPFEFSVSAQHF
jgi:hypothetical protein